MKKLLGALGAALALFLVAGLLAASPSDATTYSREKRYQRALAIMAMPLEQFRHLRAHNVARPTGIDATLDWSADHCSLDSAGAARYNAYFQTACDRHDFGYRNFGHGFYSKKNLALDPSNDRKAIVDNRLYDDSKWSCDDLDAASDCYAAAVAYFDAVSTSQKAQWAWTAGECTPNHLCLFEDDGFHDKRWMLSTSHSSLDADLDGFGDEADSLKNTSNYVWLAYADEGYRDSRLCIRPHAVVSRLDALGWGDDIDSVKKTSLTTCP